ncbi:LGFP repeat-containing protein [Mycolicibacterium lutetiense]|jgi:uncharacterized protein with LGFP repeats|uniref:Uncharacterized protein with LGFP repeats n=1 Tax=Mycolicibacterium lutetiense TaxID=1641992 RepID=A0ABS5A2V9_9MYCO|nr:hypothetical protein [Mycolicibacterium lutetiense]MBP2456094.1 uncharacterized protein with LGFP repeats [Mycolicibacterium lutetiense]
MHTATKRTVSVTAAILGFALIGSGCQAAKDAGEGAASSASSVVSSVSASVAAPDTTTAGEAPQEGASTEKTTMKGADGKEFAVSGPILAKYNTLDEAAKTSLGAPTGEQQKNEDGGVYQQFAGGVIIHSTKSYVVWGKIRDKWNELGGSQGELGYPTSDETVNADGNKQTTFEHGIVTWNPTTDEVTVTKH